MKDIIPLITTPLALAALAILVLGVALQGIKARRDVVNRVFLIILVLAILGNIGYLLTTFYASDAIIQGRASDESGNPVSEAIIDIEGIVRTASRADGEFEAIAPFSQQRSKYILVASAFGYETKRIELDGPRPPFASITLKKQDITFSEAVQLQDVIAVTQNLGDPAIAIHYRSKKKFPKDVMLTLNQIKLTAPSGGVLNLSPTLVQVNGAFTPQFLGGMNLKDAPVNSQVLVMFERAQFAKNATIGELSAQLGPYWWTTKCATPPGLKESEAGPLVKYFDAAFAWEAGEYKVTIEYIINDLSNTADLTFDISATDVNKLRAIRGKLKKCAGFAIEAQQIGALIYIDHESANYLYKTAILVGE